MNTDKNKAPDFQRGAALITSLLLVILMSLLSISGMQTAILETKMASNLQDSQKALQAAESAVRYGLQLIGQTGYEVNDFITNASNPGLYDLREANVDTSTGNKLIADWHAIRSTPAWPWDDTTKRYAMPDSLDQGSTQNPMQLVSPPQFAIGMHDMRQSKGSESYQCISYSVIGAGRGANSASRTLVEMKVIPKSSCFMSIVK